ncbi:MAG: hypothetical protein Q9221_002116 [Calogaya cf. arnoldii]
MLYLVAALRYELGEGHVFEFVEGAFPCPQAPQIKHLFPEDAQYYSYLLEEDELAMESALVELKDYLELQGPFDAVLAFSQGATLAATFLAVYGNGYFKCALFICSDCPRLLSKIKDNPRETVITIPTGHIVGREDPLFAAGIMLSEICSRSTCSIFEHSGGHEIPRGIIATADMVRLVNDMIARTILEQ